MRLIDAEEAYKVLTDYYHHKTEIQHKALKEAIERVPIADIDAITESHERIGYDRGFRDGYAEALKETDNVPDKNVGKWIDAWRSAWDGTRHWYRECSECGYERDDDSIDKDTKFCPNCGACMGVKDVRESD